jgi:hypothetical protein
MNTHPSVDVAKVLNDAGDLIKSRGWTKGTRARDSADRVVRYWSETATRWCVMGAVEKCATEKSTASWGLALDALHALRRHVGIPTSVPIAVWNDAQPGPEPVIAALRAAAQAVNP